MAFLLLESSAAFGDDQHMIDVFCEVEQTPVLLSSSRITAIENEDDVIVVHFRCWCGHEDEMRTGRRLRTPATRALSA